VRTTEIAKRLRALTGRCGTYDIFRDWVSAMALPIANAVDRRPELHVAREAEYMAIVKRHGEDGPRVMQAFKELLHDGLVPALEAEPFDVLGEVFHLLELHNKDAGQFFTPWSVALVTCELSYGDLELPPWGFVTIDEPTIGAGSMVLAQAMAMRRQGFDPSKQLHVTGTDIDRKVLLMAYVQLSLCGIPAVLYVGDTLRMQFREEWVTPVHVFDGWDARLASARAYERARALVDEVFHVEPSPALAEGAADDEPADPPKRQLALF
jgi:hypothetical protein